MVFQPSIAQRRTTGVCFSICLYLCSLVELETFALEAALWPTVHTTKRHTEENCRVQGFLKDTFFSPQISQHSEPINMMKIYYWCCWWKYLKPLLSHCQLIEISSLGDSWVDRCKIFPFIYMCLTDNVIMDKRRVRESYLWLFCSSSVFQWSVQGILLCIIIYRMVIIYSMCDILVVGECGSG